MSWRHATCKCCGFTCETVSLLVRQEIYEPPFFVSDPVEAKDVLYVPVAEPDCDALDQCVPLARITVVRWSAADDILTFMPQVVSSFVTWSASCPDVSSFALSGFMGRGLRTASLSTRSDVLRPPIGTALTYVHTFPPTFLAAAWRVIEHVDL